MSSPDAEGVARLDRAEQLRALDGISGPAGKGRVVMPRRDSMPVARSRVRASVLAGRPGRRPVRRRRDRHVDELVLEQALVDDGQARRLHEPARREGGRRSLLGPPSAVRPRSTTAKAHSACEVAAGSGRGRWTRSRWSRDGLVKRGPHPDHGLVGPQLDGGRDLGGHRADPVLVASSTRSGHL